MSDVVDNNTNEVLIEAHDLGAKFSTTIPVTTIQEWFTSLISKDKNKQKHFWALQDISFQVSKGEMIALIGKNGAGKSTLLRIIAGIQKHDLGTISIKTKVTLLGRGVGLTPELSGRENIFLGCLLLGHSIKEIEKNLDGIIDFAELREHIDRPIRYYSRGMMARLTFTIATSITPEFLLLDEILSGGDISFIHKAEKRMKDVLKIAKGGVVATHKLGFVNSFATKAIYLEKGKIKFFGDPKKAVELYLHDIKIEKMPDMTGEGE